LKAHRVAGTLQPPWGLSRYAFLLKRIFLDNGLDPSEYTNKLGWATLVTRMSEHGVPKEIGMRLTAHFNAQSYTKYDQTLEVQTHAAQRCVKESFSYLRALELETELFKQSTIEGVKLEIVEHPSLPAPVALGCSLGLKRDQEVQEISCKRSRICLSDEGTFSTRWFLLFS
jgi:hypothetical protein